MFVTALRSAIKSYKEQLLIALWSMDAQDHGATCTQRGLEGQGEQACRSPLCLRREAEKQLSHSRLLRAECVSRENRRHMESFRKL